MMSTSRMPVFQFAMKKQVSAKGDSQKKAKARSVPAGYKLLEKEGWFSEATDNELIKVIGDCPGLKAGEIAEEVANRRGLSPEARKVMTISRKTGKVDPEKQREKYKAVIYHKLINLVKSGLAERDDRGRYTLVDKKRTTPSEPMVTSLVVNSDSNQRIDELEKRVRNLEKIIIKHFAAYD